MQNVTSALIIVDVQNDFCPGGALAVPEGDKVVQFINKQSLGFGFVVATQDWHPADHGSFASSHPGCNVYDVIDLGGVQQVLWPKHCVQKTYGADFHPRLYKSQIKAFIRKGTDASVDSYSGFFDNNKVNDTGLDALLKSHGVEEVTIVGLATDYCVKFTALDAAELGYGVTVLRDGCRAVNINPDDGEKAFAEMAAAGINVV